MSHKGPCLTLMVTHPFGYLYYVLLLCVCVCVFFFFFKSKPESLREKKKRKQTFLCNLMGKATKVETVGEGVEEFHSPLFAFILF